jgi:hypothetical protein
MSKKIKGSLGNREKVKESKHQRAISKLCISYFVQPSTEFIKLRVCCTGEENCYSSLLTVLDSVTSIDFEQLTANRYKQLKQKPTVAVTELENSLMQVFIIPFYTYLRYYREKTVQPLNLTKAKHQRVQFPNYINVFLLPPLLSSFECKSPTNLMA